MLLRPTFLLLSLMLLPFHHLLQNKTHYKFSGLSCSDFLYSYSMGLETINRGMLISSKLIYLEEILKTVELIGFREEGTQNSLQAPNDQELGFSEANLVT